MAPFVDPQLHPVWRKVEAGRRLDAADGMVLLRTHDLAGVAAMANLANQRRNGARVSFVINRYINPTNVCVLTCRFCDFAKRPGDPTAFETSIEEVLEQLDDETREVHITGGHHPDWPFEYFEQMLAAIRDRFPRIQIKAFTASEIDYFWRRWKVPPEESLTRLKAAGLQLLPGGGAEILTERLHRELYPGKASPSRWLEIHRIAHGLGLRSNATMLFGHVERLDERLEHLLRLRALQDETGGFQNFIPLSYQVGETGLAPRTAPPADQLRMVALGRLMLDNVPHIQAYWVTMGEAVGALGLHFGADDLNGTLGRERIIHAAGAESPAGLTRLRLIELIRSAGRIPVERDALFRPLADYEESQDGINRRDLSLHEHAALSPAGVAPAAGPDGHAGGDFARGA